MVGVALEEGMPGGQVGEIPACGSWIMRLQYYCGCLRCVGQLW